MSNLPAEGSDASYGGQKEHFMASHVDDESAISESGTPATRKRARQETEINSDGFVLAPNNVEVIQKLEDEISNLKSANKNLADRCQRYAKENEKLQRAIAAFQAQRMKVVDMLSVDPVGARMTSKTKTKPNTPGSDQRVDPVETSMTSKTKTKPNTPNSEDHDKGQPEDDGDTPRTHSDIWTTRINDLRNFKAINGHCRVPQNWAENRALGKWVSRQREYFAALQRGAKNHLTNERIGVLESIGFEWRVGRGKAPPVKSKAEIGLEEEQRPATPVEAEAEPENETGGEPQEQSGAVTCLTFPIAAESNRFSSRWNERYEELCEYQRIHGDCLVPQLYHTPLGKWVSRQRESYNRHENGKTTTLKQHQVDKLNQIGFTWKVAGHHRPRKSSTMTPI